MTDRPTDPSTGRQREISDAEAFAATAEFHAARWRERDGEKLELVVLADGLTALGRTWKRGDTIRVDVGSEQFWSTVNPSDGSTILLMDADTQISRWGRRMLAPAGEVGVPEATDPYQDDRPNRSDRRAGGTAERQARESWEALKRLYREEDEQARQPIRQQSRTIRGES